VIITQKNLDQLAERIERAYRRKHPNWVATGVTPGVWTSAAIRLHDASSIDPSTPIDPELFVAVQKETAFRCDPWHELTQEAATRVYRVAIRKIVRHLKAELAAELRCSKRFLKAGGSIEAMMTHSKSRISPIIKLVVCHRSHRSDLAEVVRPAAEAQHLACPLYRIACDNLLKHSDYPNPKPDLVPTWGITNQKHMFAWN